MIGWHTPFKANSREVASSETGPLPTSDDLELQEQSELHPDLVRRPVRERRSIQSLGEFSEIGILEKLFE